MPGCDRQERITGAPMRRGGDAAACRAEPGPASARSWPMAHQVIALVILCIASAALCRAQSSDGPNPASPATSAQQPATDQSNPAIEAEAPPPNLLFNGDFSEADEIHHLPIGWTTKQPDHVRLADLGDGRGSVVQMTGGKKLMGSYGTDLLSRPIPIEPNMRYRCTGYTRSDGPKMIVFVKGYATVRRTVDGREKVFDDAVYQMKKEIEPTEQWTRFNLDFDLIPAKLFSDHQHEVKYVRVLLWAYWPAGTCWYSDIRFERVGPAPDSMIRHDKAVTHTGEKARLSAQANRPDETAFDAEQAWVDAANAWREQQYDQALDIALKLVGQRPDNAKYRLLAARAAVRAGEPAVAAEHVRWLLGEVEDGRVEEPATRKIEPWQRDFARVCQARLLAGSGNISRARQVLADVITQSDSPHARAAASDALERLEGPDGQSPPAGD